MSGILITGAAGMVGQALLRRIGGRQVPSHSDIIATDIRRPTYMPRGAQYEPLDVTKDDPDRVIGALRPRAVVHLASIVTPPRDSTRALEYEVDVAGTRRVLTACVKYGVRRLVVTSSGAAYGYHADNPVPLKESDPLRGNAAFAYSDHKRQVEEMLATVRQTTPELEQVVLRVGTVLGAGVENQITALFHKKRLLGIRGSDSPFVFIWTEDLARILYHAATDGPPGIFNVAADGQMGLEDLAAAMGKPVRRLPGGVLRTALGLARPLRLSRYGPEQVGFLQYRPVLDNTALKTTFGYTPELTARQVFALWQRDALGQRNAL